MWIHLVWKSIQTQYTIITLYINYWNIFHLHINTYIISSHLRFIDFLLWLKLNKHTWNCHIIFSICFDHSESFQLWEKCQCSYFLYIHGTYIFFKLWDCLFQTNIWDVSDSFFVFFLFLAPSFVLFGWFSFLSFFFFFVLSIIMTNAVPDDQSPSSPASRWPGANYGNRTLGVCFTASFTWHHPPLWAITALLLAA